MQAINYLIIVIASFCFQNAYSQQINWRETKEWKIYKLRGHGLFAYSLDTLHNFKNSALNQDSMIQFVADVKVVRKDSIPVWMGEYVATCIFRGKKLKLELSTYGGFFYCEADQHIYQVPTGLKREWQDYIVTCYGTLYP